MSVAEPVRWRSRRAISLRLVLGTLLVAGSTALFAVAFRTVLAWVYRSIYLADNVVDAIAGLPPAGRLLVPLAGATVAGLVARWRTSGGQNASNVMEAIALGRIRLSLRVTASRVLSSAAAIATGMSIGREGPLIEAGGALGFAIARGLQTTLTQTRVLIAAGTAAGFAAAYNTPFAAVLFVLETIAGVTAPELVMPVTGATVIATIVARVTVGTGPIYGQRAFAAGEPRDFVFFALLGVLAAAAAIAFKALLRRFEQLFERVSRQQPWRALLGGLVVGLIAVRLPAVAGNGYEPLNRLLDAPYAPAAVLLLIIAKMCATGASVASGIPGGVFTPMLLVGAGVGASWAFALSAAGFATVPPGSYALIGMAAATAASIHAPMTAAVMVFELSGDYGVVLPLLLATTVATAVSRAAGSQSVYEAELQKRGLAWDVTLEGRRLVDSGRSGQDATDGEDATDGQDGDEGQERR